MDNLITGITVTWNNQDLIQRAYESIRRFHSLMKIIIVNGSDINDPGYHYVNNIKDNNLTIINVGYNIGHGRGFLKAIDLVDTPYFLFFDTDIEMLKSPIEQMMSMMKEDTYGVGPIIQAGFDGHDYGYMSNHYYESPVLYIHPYFQLIQKSQYDKFHPYIHHGAPCISAMIDIYNRNLSEKILIHFYGLQHSQNKHPQEYIWHHASGTSVRRVASGLPHIEGQWEAVILPTR